MKHILLMLVLAIIATSANAQVINYETKGNLAPTHKVGCIDVSNAAGNLSPADLATGVLACFDKKEDDRAAELMILMQVRAKFDTLRVADQTAHQAMLVLPLNLSQARGPDWSSRMQAAFQRFGAAGSPRHTEFCNLMRKSPPPTHSPNYMIQHGMKAALGDTKNPLVSGFDAKAAWNEALNSYLKCASK